MDSPTRLYLIRHGEVEERYHRVFGGRIDMDLSALGQEQAGALANYLQKVPFDAIYRQPNATGPANPRSGSSKIKPGPTVLDQLREVDFGVWTGLAWEEIHGRFGISAYEWLQQLEQGNDQPSRAAQRLPPRIEAAVQTILEGRPGPNHRRRVPWRSHSHDLSILLHLPLSKMAGFDFEYASLTILSIGCRTKWRCSFSTSLPGGTADETPGTLASLGHDLTRGRRWRRGACWSESLTSRRFLYAPEGRISAS